MVVKFGKGALMTKMDIESAYRLVPVHPHDRPLQAMEWQGNLDLPIVVKELLPIVS